MGTWDFDDIVDIKKIVHETRNHFQMRTDAETANMMRELRDPARKNRIPIAPEWEKCQLLDIYTYEDNFGNVQFCGIFRDPTNSDFGPFTDRIPKDNKAVENGFYALIAQYDQQ